MLVLAAISVSNMGLLGGRGNSVSNKIMAFVSRRIVSVFDLEGRFS